MTKSKILQAAIREYSKFNYHGATMRNIAKEVGIKPASIYFFYKNKEALFLAAFQKLLEDHFIEMQSILQKVHDRPILDIFEALIKGTVAYHQENIEETNAYISLVTSPPPEIHEFLQEHIQQFDDWLINSLMALIKRDIPSINEHRATSLIKQFVVIMDGIFWEINLYDQQQLKDQIKEALYIMRILLGGYENEK